MKKNNNQLFKEILNVEDAAYVFDLNLFEKNISNLFLAFSNYYPKMNIGYSYKTNYVPNVCKSAHKQGCWAEVVSDMEVEMANEYLEDKSKIIFNGPVKSFESIIKIVENNGIINIDNHFDIKVLDDIISTHNFQKKIQVALRLNFAYENNKSRFGMDFDTLNDLKIKIRKSNHLDLIGYHIHLPFRSVDSFKFRIDSLINILKLHGDFPLKYINIGGGFFGNISKDLAISLGLDNPPTFDDYGKLIGEELSNYFNHLPNSEWPDLFIEPGSSLVADSFSFITKIHSIKSINDSNIITTFAARHLLSPTNKTVMLPVELISSNSDIMLNSTVKEYNVVGYTCIESDIIGQVKANEIIDEQDYIKINNVGSYTIVMGSDFILPQPAIYLFYNNKVTNIRRKKTVRDILTTFQ